MKRLAILSLVAGLSVAATAAMAEGPRGKRFADVERDADGAIILSSLSEDARARLAAADTNGDGKVSKEEMRAFREGRRGEMKAKAFDRIDANNDGVISREEWDAHEPRRGHRGKRGE
jgi:hypothetical protein